MTKIKGKERNKPSSAKQRPLSLRSEVGGIRNKETSRAPRTNANNFALSSPGAIHRLAQLAAHVEEEEGEDEDEGGEEEKEEEERKQDLDVQRDALLF